MRPAIDRTVLCRRFVSFRRSGAGTASAREFLYLLDKASLDRVWETRVLQRVRGERRCTRSQRLPERPRSLGFEDRHGEPPKDAERSVPTGFLLKQRISLLPAPHHRKPPAPL